MLPARTIAADRTQMLAARQRVIRRIRRFALATRRRAQEVAVTTSIEGSLHAKKNRERPSMNLPRRYNRETCNVSAPGNVFSILVLDSRRMRVQSLKIRKILKNDRDNRVDGVKRRRQVPVRVNFESACSILSRIISYELEYYFAVSTLKNY